MMTYIKEIFIKNRSLGYLIGLISAFVLLVASVVFYIIIQPELTIVSHEGLTPTQSFLLILLSSLTYIGITFIKNEKISFLLNIIPVILASLGLAIHFNLTTYPLADIYTGVQFFGGSAPLFVTFAIVYLLGIIGYIISNFSPSKKL